MKTAATHLLLNRLFANFRIHVGVVLTTWIIVIYASSSGLANDNEKLRKVGEQVQKSIVQISIIDTDGRESSVGTGFAVAQKGLIATNLHVIGEGRSFVVKDSDGKALKVKEVTASDRFLDLAILRLEEERLQPLKLADYTKVQKGQPFVAIGHPQGLKDSLVQGVISSKRVIEGRPMLQVAMPVEAGNSGGPVINAAGEVVGIVTLKSVATDNIGFAIGSHQIRDLIEKPNPVKFSQWQKIGILRPDLWQPKFGASWRQKGGRILAHSTGDGFGGRTLCICQQELPSPPYEIEVEVKLDDESGAAGLAFLIDEQDRHYGFYPSNGKLRFSRFEGPTPYQWTVLDEKNATSYKPERWNRLKVRIGEQSVTCFVNNMKVADYKDKQVKGLDVGLAKFRDTRAEFRNFRIGKSLPSVAMAPEKRKELQADLKKKLDNGRFESILRKSQNSPLQSREMILDEVTELEEKIARLKHLSNAVHVENVKQNFAKVIQQKRDDDIQLIDACLWIAKLDDPDLQTEGYKEYFDDLTAQLKSLSPTADTKDTNQDQSAESTTNTSKTSDQKTTDTKTLSETKVEVLNQFLFETNGYHGSRHDYYRPENSYLSSVLDDREGIPITLSILYIELGKSIGLSIDGIGLPGHFLVSVNRKGQPPQLIDVFENGKKISTNDAKFIVASTTTLSWDENYLSPVSKKQILFRVLSNLRGIAERTNDREAIWRYLELMHVLEPDDVSIKGTRALLLFQKGFQQKALDELDQIIEQRPTGLDLRMLQSMRRRLQAEMDRATDAGNSN